MARPSPIRFGLVGGRLGHSWSREIHQQLGSWPYELIELDDAGAKQFFLEGVWQGLNVTIPHKALAASIADERSGRVERIGAANTLVRGEDGRILAENTDVLGFSWLLERFSKRAFNKGAQAAYGGKKALVLGSGGASAAVRAALEDLAMDVVIVSRSAPETYEGLSTRHADAALLVNATPVGMHPNCPASPIEPDVLAELTGLTGVVDLIYNPLRTKLLMDAEDLGLPAENGLGMLVAQAYFASEIFQGEKLDEEGIYQIWRALEARMANIVLIGMPGVGKSSTGRKLARMLGRPYVDLDDVIEIDCGKSPAQIIEEDGEPAFRAAETAALARSGSQSGLVIACGGGIVTQQQNYQLAHQNGVVIHLKRDISTLSMEGRPLSARVGLEQLYSERAPLYARWADHVIECTGTPEGDANLILETIGLA